eukprot:gnl/TRDRNA2_/TRDRNA2_36268_c0_seq2.p1 gnl/TRDRNA2_/TRDRNA2_36268_c0~~gnl/TRDRNA2_/TRDRNA2_36268_c0_seq2.p1  ORF type:complete len:387 (-),score=104.90 gnl/TRDRNA2_/TRDRNA2_36268_c0_seq2:130-1290(-)
MASSAVPYIGSKISLISNSDIRYEGVLYTINTKESTIALQGVRSCGTEGRKMPEIPPSNEVYDFIIFRGQDIKDLSVLESAKPQPSGPLSDPAVMSVNQRPAGVQQGYGANPGVRPPPAPAAVSSYKGSGGWGQSSQQQKGGGGWGSQQGGGWDGWGSQQGWGQQSKGGSMGKGSMKGGGGGWQQSPPSSKGKDSKGSGMKGGYGDSGKGYGDRGKGTSKGYGDSGKGKAEKGGKGKDSGKTGKGRSDDGGKGGGSRRGGRSSGGNDGLAVGELLPEVNEAVKKELAEDFDYSASNAKFEKVGGTEADGVTEELKPLPGYDKSKSFFDSISCEMTDRAAGAANRQKIDRETAQQIEKETFGETRRPPRGSGWRREKGKGKGGGKKS